MEIDKVIKERRNIRTYNDKIISEDIIKELIEAAQWAPSACNRQGVRFIILNEEDIKKLTYAGTAWFLPEAKQGLLVLYNNMSDNTEYQDHLLSGAAAVQNLILKAWSIGVGVGWVNNTPPTSVIKRLFKIPWNYDVICFLGLGYFDEKPPAMGRIKKLEEIYCHHSFSLPEKIPSRFGKQNIKLKIKRFFRWSYNHLPLFIKQHFKKFAYKYERKFWLHLSEKRK